MTESISAERLAGLKEEFRRGFIAWVGYRVDEIDAGRLTSRLDVRPEHRQQDGFVHAGVLSAMADHTAGYAAFTLVPDDHRILTIEYKINFLRPALGPELVCRARVLRAGRSTLPCEADVFDRDGDREVLAARALLTMASVPATRLNRSPG
jgi:uncharacterized protein (TIGR00369 family)